VAPALHTCLASLFASKLDGPLEVWLVDNASTDGSQRRAVLDWPAIHLLQNDSNLGFAPAVNQGLRQARHALGLLLNPDVALEPGTVQELVRFLGDHPEAAAVGPGLVDADGALQGSARREPTPLTGLFGRSALLTRLFPENPITRRELPGLALGNGAPLAVDWISGACLLARRTAWEAVGLMDERFFLFWEDADWCRRFRQAGWRVFYQPAARKAHQVGVSRAHRSVRSAVDFHRSAYRYYRKHHVTGRWSPLAPLVAGGLVVSLALRLPEAVRRRHGRGPRRVNREGAP
jgi:hypothetical protein